MVENKSVLKSQIGFHSICRSSLSLEFRKLVLYECVKLFCFENKVQMDIEKLF